MNAFPITWGHVIFAVVVVALYDLAWDLVAKDHWSDWWFQRKQVPLRLMFWGAVMTLLVLDSVNWVLAVLLLVGLVLLFGGYILWRYLHRKNGRPEQPPAPPSPTPSRPAGRQK